jgi:hypothetical protein
MDKCYTITYGDVAENHARMQQIGSLHESGYSLETLKKVRKLLRGKGLKCQLYSLHKYLDQEDVEEAYILVIRKGAQFIIGNEDTSPLIAENDCLEMDKMALMKGSVVNKRARWNLCFAEEDQEPLYEDGKGRIVAWKRIPLMQKIRETIAEWTEDVLLNGEANYYYDISKCGIGFHGDGERRKVFAVRMGNSSQMPLYFRWYQNSTPIGPKLQFNLDDGDMYMMSEKAVGFDWLKKKTATLRHATGAKRFTNV